MSDYMFMLESHLSPEQNRAVALIETAAGSAGLTAFLTGGATRDMLGGLPIRDLDFTVEGNAAKLVRLLTQKHDVKIVSTDNDRKASELVFPGGVTAEVTMAQQLQYAKPGSKPHANAATIHEDLRGRDFTINSIALSLNRASRGLLLDPANGLGDLERRELRANSNYTLYDDPGRMLRMWRLQVRMGFTIEERTNLQYQNVREAKLEEKIPKRVLLPELRAIAAEPNPGELLAVLDREGLLKLFSPALTGENLNSSGFAKLQKAQQLVPFGVSFHANPLGLFLYTLTEKLSSREKSQLVSSLGMPKADVDTWQKLEAKSKKLETALKSARLKKASLVYQLLREAQGDQVLFLLLRSNQRIVHDRIKNFLQKYLVTANEVTDRDVVQLGFEPGTPKFAKKKEELIFGYLDGRIRKPAPPPEPPPPPVHHARAHR